MKKKTLLALLMALIFTFTSAFPAFAGEGELFPEQGEETAQQPEDEWAEDNLEPDPDPDPDEELPPVLPEPPDEGEGVPPVTEETPDTDDDEDPDEPHDPADSETPDEDEEPSEDPADEENPDEETPDEEDPEEESDPDAEEEAPIIDVFVPASGQVVINPYHMKVETSAGETTEQIVHEPQALVNYSEIPVQVDAWAIGRLAGESKACFVSAPPAEGMTEKAIFMYLEFQQYPDQWTGWYNNFANQILITGWGESKANVMTLLPGGEGWYRLSGAMTDFPEEMWQSEDAASVTIVFSFSPVPEVLEEPEFPEMFHELEIPEFTEFPETWDMEI